MYYNKKVLANFLLNITEIWPNFLLDYSANMLKIQLKLSNKSWN